jgi:hypothetical protein
LHDSEQLEQRAERRKIRLHRLERYAAVTDRPCCDRAQAGRLRDYEAFGHYIDIMDRGAIRRRARRAEDEIA